MIDFVKARRWYLTGTVILAIIGIIALVVPPRIHWGLEFSSGTSMTIPFTVPVDQTDLRNELTKAGFADSVIQKVGSEGNTYLVRTRSMTEDQRTALVGALNQRYGSTALTIAFNNPVTQVDLKAEVEKLYPTATVDTAPGVDNSFVIKTQALTSDEQNSLLASLVQRLGDTKGAEAALVSPIDQANFEFDFVDPLVARRSIVNTFWAVIAASVGILLYVWWAFRKVPDGIRYGVSSIVAILHDIMMVLGTFAIIAKFTPMQIDSLLITGILAIIGISVNNTVVVFDRIRENTARSAGKPFDVIANISVNETLTRNLATSLTTVLAIMTVLLLGGSTIRDFMLVLLIGIVAGTYSSILVATALLVAWSKGELPKLRLPFRRRAAVPASR